MYYFYTKQENIKTMWPKKVINSCGRTRLGQNFSHVFKIQQTYNSAMSFKARNCLLLFLALTQPPASIDA